MSQHDEAEAVRLMGVRISTLEDQLAESRKENERLKAALHRDLFPLDCHHENQRLREELAIANESEACIRVALESEQARVQELKEALRALQGEASQGVNRADDYGWLCRSVLSHVGKALGSKTDAG
jgi:hypothetical protein